MNGADTADIQGLMRSLAERSRDESLRQELLGCLRKECWSATIRCCTAHLDGYMRRPFSLDLMTEGLFHAQIGVAHMLDRQPAEAIKHYKKAEALFTICDTNSAGLVKLLLGRAYAELNEQANASTCYRESIELLSRVRNPFAEQARAWRFQLLARESQTSTPDRFRLLADAEREQVRARVYAEEGDSQNAIDAYNDAIRLFAAGDHVKSLVECLVELGDLQARRDAWGDARRAYDEALGFALGQSDGALIDRVKSQLRLAIREERRRTSGETRDPENQEPGGTETPGGSPAVDPGDGSQPDAQPTEPSPPDEPGSSSMPPEDHNKADTSETKPEEDSDSVGSQLEAPLAAAPKPKVIPLRVKPVIKERVSAGKPLAAWDVGDTIIQVEKFLIDTIEYGVREVFTPAGDLGIDSFEFAVRIAGDSMESLLHDGEYVLARRESAPSNGAISIVRIPGHDGDEVLVKRFFRQRDHILLQPENEAASWLILLEKPEDRERLLAKYASINHRVTVDSRLNDGEIEVYAVVAVLAPLEAAPSTPSPAAAPAPS
jgi:tetratricopeptide (TPR) repeat protein